MSIGGSEIVLLVVIVVVLFGPTIAAFWLGFTLGKKKSSAPTAGSPSAPAATSAAESKQPSEETADE